MRIRFAERFFVPVMSILSVLLAVSCGGPARQDFPHQPGEVYEWVWADPTILISDTLITILQAKRIDSFKVEQPLDLSAAAENGLRFRVYPEACVVSIYMENPFDQKIVDLFTGRLEPGYYKVNVQPSRINDPLRVFPSYMLIADVCYQTVKRPVIP